MTKRLLTFTVAILLIFINIPLQTFATSTNVTIKLRVGYVENYGVVKTPSFAGYEGFGYEYLNKIVEYTENKYIIEFVQCDWNEGLQMLREGKIDLLVPAHYDISREDDYIYSTQVFADDTSFLASTKTGISINSSNLNLLEGTTIGIQEGNLLIHILNDILDKNDIKAQVIETTIGAFEDEQQNQLYDYVLVSSLFMVNDMNLTFNIDTSPTYLLTSKNNQKLMDDLDYGMQRVNEYEYLFKELLYLKYFDHDLSSLNYISSNDYDILKEQSVYNVGVVNLYSTFGFYNNTELVGINYDIINQLQELAGVNFNIVELDADFLENDTSNLDFYFYPIGHNYITENTKSDPLMSTPIILIQRIDNNKSNQNSIGILNNYKLNDEIINSILPDQNVIEFGNINALCTAFQSGGVDNLLVTNATYTTIYHKIAQVNHTIKVTDLYEYPAIIFNENFPQDKIDVFNKLISHIDDSFVQASLLKNVSIINERETSLFYQNCIRTLIVLVLIIAGFLNHIKNIKELAIREIASHDELTGLYTLPKFIEQTGFILEKNPDMEYTLISFDIDNFKYINEIFNYETGSNILKDISETIKINSNEDLLISRVLADNFIILTKTSDFRTVMQLLLTPDNQIFNEIRKYLDEHYVVNFSIGSYNITDKSLDIAYMIDCCNLARSFSKMELGNTFNAFSEDMKKQENIKNNILAHMNQALVDKEFVLYYQPKFDIKTKKITGAEALVRWFSDGKMIPPNNFIPLFETNGFIENLDYYVVETACEFIASINNINLPVISVNLSGITIMKKDVVDNVMRILRKHKVQPVQLDLEITESAFVEHFEIALDSIDQFRELGFTISMDDFGAGISSLNRLKEISIDILKIDREFIVGSLENEKGSKIIRNIVNMAKDLKLETVAEGIETDEQLDFLRNLGCDIGQGYYFSRPLPQNDFVDLLLDEKN